MNFWWVLRSFGLMAAWRYLWDITKLRIKRLFTKEKPKRFEDLSDAEAEQVAWAFGIHKWDDRDHLNRVWHNFEKTLN
jgi:hypothetical protein